MKTEKTLKQETQLIIKTIRAAIFKRVMLKPSKCPYDYLEVNDSMFKGSSKKLMRV